MSGKKVPGGFGVIDAFELEEAFVASQYVGASFLRRLIPGIWICISLSTTIAQVTGSGMDVSTALLVPLSRKPT